MIYAKDGAVAVEGDGLKLMTELGTVMAELMQSLRRQGRDPEAISAFFHYLVDTALKAPASEFTIDLSHPKEG